MVYNVWELYVSAIVILIHGGFFVIIFEQSIYSLKHIKDFLGLENPVKLTIPN